MAAGLLDTDNCRINCICTVQDERIAAVRNVFGNTTATLFGLWDIRYLYRTDR